MSLAQLTLANVRCIEQADLSIPSGLTLFYGGNGAGKTSLLEAIFLLGRGRSFRTRNNERLIRRGQDQLTVIGHVVTEGLPPRPIAVQVTPDRTSARISGRPTGSLVELSQAFPVQVIEPGIHRLVEEGGFRRRRWMDWAVFHVEPRYVDAWVRYTRALRQRNAALKSD
ncbi:MAG TPA: AAA family ATPase, partial [Steroidobacteraceae bacterium]|nr:AAA family ATPase [Steroidobacteraceae bacterium]